MKGKLIFLKNKEKSDTAKIQLFAGAMKFVCSSGIGLRQTSRGCTSKLPPETEG